MIVFPQCGQIVAACFKDCHWNPSKLSVGFWHVCATALSTQIDRYAATHQKYNHRHTQPNLRTKRVCDQAIYVKFLFVSAAAAIVSVIAFALLTPVVVLQVRAFEERTWSQLCMTVTASW